jgi:pyruvate/2-oxoglutarate/acetoin dehydrogenase E1 component
MRKTTKAFADSHQDIEVLDLSSLLPLDAYYDGAHVYDDINTQIAETLANYLRANLKRLIQKKALSGEVKSTS